MPTSDNRRALRVLSSCLLAAVVVAACSSDDKSSSTTPTTAAGAETTAAPATDAPSGTEDTTPAATGQGLTVGVIVPPPGLLETLFEGQLRGINDAAADIKAGGGVLGGELTVNEIHTPLGQSASSQIQGAVDAGNRVLIGPSGSADAQAAIPELARLSTLACTASATLPNLTVGDDTQSIFRTVVSDNILTTWLSEQITARRDAEFPNQALKVAIVARSDDYGLSVGNGLAASLQATGFVPAVIGYDPNLVQFNNVAQQVIAQAPNLTILISYEEGPSLLGSLVNAGLPATQILGLDSFFTPRLPAISGATDPNLIEGFTALGTTGDRAFLQRMISEDSNGQVAYAAQAYDCAIILALAAELVESQKADTISNAVRAVTAGGLTCTTYADCKSKQDAGDDIDYDGPSGKLAIDAHGDATSVRFTQARIQGGVLVNVTNTDVDIADLQRQQAAYAAAALNTKVQQALRFLGFYTGPIDGLESPEMTAAVAAFQTSVGLQPTGVVDGNTLGALQASLGAFSDLFGSSVIGIQQLLTDLGFYTGPIDGVWTDAVTAGMRALQAELGVPQTGVPDAATLKAAFDRGITVGISSVTTTTEPPTTTTTEPPTTIKETTTAPPTTTAAPAPGLTISGNAFSEAAVTAGTEFTITNKDAVAHTVTADDGTFDVAVPAGGTVPLKIDTPGSFAIHCRIHASMHGTITVA
ncbi:MAG TPA: peptidoglycan-binding protein [Ilumatobacteraceae bacterium]|nr:peptidoglycan-binding protein [Ilumatobacteraceae bacterium]